ncbi:MAG: hypothetical protein ABSE15_06995 [Candidatus Bathyarchaeia archaeon]
MAKRSAFCTYIGSTGITKEKYFILGSARPPPIILLQAFNG